MKKLILALPLLLSSCVAKPLNTSDLQGKWYCKATPLYNTDLVQFLSAEFSFEKNGELNFSEISKKYGTLIHESINKGRYEQPIQDGKVISVFYEWNQIDLIKKHSEDVKKNNKRFTLEQWNKIDSFEPWKYEHYGFRQNLYITDLNSQNMKFYIIDYIDKNDVWQTDWECHR